MLRRALRVAVSAAAVKATMELFLAIERRWPEPSLETIFRRAVARHDAGRHSCAEAARAFRELLPVFGPIPDDARRLIETLESVAMPPLGAEVN